MGDCPRFIDFEASGLGPHSFPIQAAWSDAGGEVASYLIRPHAAWRLEQGWEPRAEAIHGLPLVRVQREGLGVGEVAARMNVDLAGTTVYADGLPHDRLWCDQLFESAGMERQFEIGDFYDLIVRTLPPTATRRPGWLEAYREAIWRRLPRLRRHDAGNDVRYLVEFYRVASAGATKSPGR